MLTYKVKTVKVIRASDRDEDNPTEIIVNESQYAIEKDKWILAENIEQKESNKRARPRRNREEKEEAKE